MENIGVMKKNSIYILLILIGWAFSGCEDQLNALPGQSKVEGNVIVDQKSAEAALNGVYYRFVGGEDDRGTYSTVWALQHEVYPGMFGAYLRRVWGGGADDNSKVNASSSFVKSFWSYSYLIINAANGVIKQMEPFPKEMFMRDRKAEIIAEARFMRAYGHYNLLRYFAQFYDVESEYGILLRDEFVTTLNLAKKRSGVKETYDFILEDLDDAILHAPEENKVIYVNRWVAKGMKARVLMMRGLESDYEEVIRLAGDIIEHGPYELEDRLQDIFSNKGIKSSEVMLGVEPMANQVNKHDTYFYDDEPEYKVLPTFMDLLEGDPRESWVIGDEFEEGTRGVSKFSGLRLEDGYAMRLTEMYLLLAEAIVRSGGDMAEAKGLLKTVMQRAGITDFNDIDAINDRDELLWAIYEETVKNVGFEDGIEWNALLRFPLEKIQRVNPTIKDRDRIIFPIPADEFDKNPLIGKQNPGYSKN